MATITMRQIREGEVPPDLDDDASPRDPLDRYQRRADRSLIAPRMDG